MAIVPAPEIDFLANDNRHKRKTFSHVDRAKLKISVDTFSSGSSDRFIKRHIGNKN